MNRANRRSSWITLCARLTLAAFAATLPGPAAWAQAAERVAPVETSAISGEAGAALSAPSLLAPSSLSSIPLAAAPLAAPALAAAPLAAPAAALDAAPLAAPAAAPGAVVAAAAPSSEARTPRILPAGGQRPAADGAAGGTARPLKAATDADASALTDYAAGVRDFDGGAYFVPVTVEDMIGARRSRENRDFLPHDLAAAKNKSVLMPGVRIGFTISAESRGGKNLLAAQRGADQGYILMVTDGLQSKGLPFRTATVAKVISAKIENGSVEAIIDGVREARIKGWDEKSFRAEVAYGELPLGDTQSITKLTKEAKGIFARMGVGAKAVDEVVQRGPRALANHLADAVISHQDLSLDEQQALLRADTVEHRLALAVSALRDADPQAKEEEAEGKDDDAALLARQIEKAGMPEYAKTAALKELKRMKRDKGERENIRKWLELMVELPWSRRKPETVDLKKAKAILDAEHSGLEDVKKIILKSLAVRAQTGDTKGGVMGFEGPPGVGKTTIAKAWAAATGRDLVVISFGGKTDEKYLRGFSRTYHNSDAGVLMKVLRGISRNAVIVLDEADQTGQDANGNLMAALLELLDPEQNTKFKDTYLDVPFDLSDIMFIATGNDFSKFPDAVKDRMKIVPFGSYTLSEKIKIGQEHATSRMLKKNGLKDIRFTDEAMRALITGYTMEAGVRDLHNKIDDLFAEIVYRHQVDGEAIPSLIEPDDVAKYLGPPKHSKDRVAKNGVGMSTGLGVSSLGGSTLSVQAKLVPGGSGQLVLRAEMGDTFKDSAQNAWAYVRSRAEDFGLDLEKFKGQELHLSMAPSGKIDGPSAGLAMATAIVSALTGRPVLDGVAMTGAIDLNGEAWAIGGLREKVMAAERKGYTKVLYPVSNEVHVPGIPSEVSSRIELRGVNNFDEVLEQALAPKAEAAAK